MDIESNPARKVFYGTSPSQFLLLDYPTRDHPHALVLFIHGGFWKSEYGIDPHTAGSHTLAPDLLAHGFAVAQIEYRRSDDDQWGWPHTNQDVLDAYKKALSLVSDSMSHFGIILIGHSAGGTLALWLGAQLVKENFTPLPNYVMALAPVADLRMAARMRLSDRGDAVQRYMHGTPDQIPHQYDCACPTAIADALASLNIRLVVGSADEDVPIDVVDSLCECIRDTKLLPNKQRASLAFDVFTKAGHFDLTDANSTVWPLLRDRLLQITQTSEASNP